MTFCTAIKGKHGFSEGKHYWEVSLQRPNLDVKKSWWIGLTNAEEQNTFRRLFLQNVSIASGNSWFLASSSKCQNSLQLRSESQSCNFPYMRLQTVGVYLNCDSKNLMFFDVEKKTEIASMKIKFTGEVFPLFNPGIKDISPMMILHKAVKDASSCEDNA